MSKVKEPLRFDLDRGYHISPSLPWYGRQVGKSVLSVYYKFNTCEGLRRSEGSIEFGIEGLLLGISIDTIIELKHEGEEILDFGEIYCTEIPKKKFANQKHKFTFDRGVNFKQMTTQGINPNVCYVYDYVIEQPPHRAKSSNTRDAKISDIKKKLDEIDKKLRKLTGNR